MESPVHPIVCLSGNPTDDEVTAIALAVMSLRASVVEKNGEKHSAFRDNWGLSGKYQYLGGLKSKGLAGQMSNFQLVSRLRARY